MSGSSYNLLTEDWIPTMRADGGVQLVGVRRALYQAHELGDIRCMSPLSTAALTRILLAVLYRACGPQTMDEWEEMLLAGRFPEERVTRYLDDWHERFDLFSPTRPFMQTPGLSMGHAGSLAQLAAETAAGNTPTLFDHTTDALPRPALPAEAARLLVTAQAFALGFGKAGNAIVDGTTIQRPYFADAICLRGVTLWLSGASLFETLMLNLVPFPRDATGRPEWERPDPLESCDRLTGKERISRLAEGPADRYAWTSRLLLLIQEDDGTVQRAYFTQGREADKVGRDPMKAYTASKEEGVYAIGLNASKAAWRDLTAYLETGNLGCQILQHAASQTDAGVLERGAAMALNVVGLATDPGKAGKFVMWRHDRVSVPAAILADRDAKEALATALRDAEFVAFELGGRMRSVAWWFLPPEGNPDMNDVASLAAALDPRTAFWARVEQHFAHLLTDLGRAEAEALPVWRKRLEGEARRAFAAACDRLGDSSRAIRAVAHVSALFSADAAEASLKRKQATRKSRDAKTKGGKIA